MQLKRSKHSKTEVGMQCTCGKASQSKSLIEEIVGEERMRCVCV